MSVIKGDKAAKFIAWLECIKGFLPATMTLEEASQIFLRREEEKEREKNEKKESVN